MADDIDIDYYCTAAEPSEDESWARAKDLLTEIKTVDNMIKIYEAEEESGGIMTSTWRIKDTDYSVKVQLYIDILSRIVDIIDKLIEIKKISKTLQQLMLS